MEGEKDVGRLPALLSLHLREAILQSGISAEIVTHTRRT
jgi:hypothetical protein